MDDLKFEILNYLYHSNNREARRHHTLNCHLDKLKDARSAINDLLKLKYITRPVGRDYYKLTTPGAEAYESEKQHRDQETKQESKENAEKLAKMSLAKVQEKKNLRNNLLIAGISSVFSVLFALFIEHFPQILNTIASLFK